MLSIWCFCRAFDNVGIFPNNCYNYWYAVFIMNFKICSYFISDGLSLDNPFFCFFLGTGTVFNFLNIEKSTKNENRGRGHSLARVSPSPIFSPFFFKIFSFSPKREVKNFKNLKKFKKLFTKKYR